ncbi:capsular polysaccharide export protein, LipB/KpsS family [Roseimarinus sediminis]|uniref:capsular polysaccharide export protein, LipB/KpsS family n=1 Tax=Roseimarinus sediminis TaxID=1610899 RepID=UPI003D1C6403
MNNTICLYARSGHNLLFSKLGSIFIKNGFKVVYIINQEKEEENIRKYNKNAIIYNLMTFIEKNWDNENILKSINLSDIENKYSIDSIWRLFYTDRYLTKYNFEDSEKHVKLHVAFVEKIYNTHKPKFFINELIALFSSYLFYSLSKKHNCTYLALGASQYSYNYFYVSFDDEYTIHSLENKYKTGKFSDNEIELASKFIEKIRVHKKKPDYMIKTGKKPALKFKDLFRVSYYFYSLLFTHNSKINYENDKKSVAYNAINYIKYQSHKKFYHKPDFTKTFYLFPLHFQPEATTLTFAQNYEKQILAIDLLAKKIPGNSVLYVKEHYARLGHRKTDFYKELKRYPNVFIINPWEDTFELINKSKAVIVLTGTTGFEAIIMRKPVIILGNTYYKEFKFAKVIKNINNLTSALKNIDDSIYDNHSQYDKELKLFCAAYITSLYKGAYHHDKECANDDKNIIQIYSSLVEVMDSKSD